MPFIKFAIQVESADGPFTKLRFVNVDHVSVATWDDRAKTLSLSVKRQRGEEESIELSGEDAKKALEKLQSL